MISGQLRDITDVTDSGSPSRTLIHESLEQNVAVYSSKPAVLCKHTFVTYAELNSAANRIAHTLVEAGLRRGQRVGIYLPNSIAQLHRDGRGGLRRSQGGRSLRPDQS